MLLTLALLGHLQLATINSPSATLLSSELTRTAEVIEYDLFQVRRELAQVKPLPGWAPAVGLGLGGAAIAVFGVSYFASASGGWTGVGHAIIGVALTALGGSLVLSGIVVSLVMASINAGRTDSREKLEARQNRLTLELEQARARQRQQADFPTGESMNAPLGVTIRF